MAHSVFCQPISGLNIHRIRTDGKSTKADNPSEFVTKIIENYIERHRERLVQGTLKYQEVSSDQWDSSLYHSFQLKIYAFSKTTLTPLQRLMGQVAGNEDKFSGVSSYFIIFFYRAISTVKVASQSSRMKKCWDIYALVNGDGWMAVKPYSDYNFPLCVALRVVDPKLYTLETKALAGDKEASTETYKSAYRLQSYEHDTLWRIFKIFASKFKENASIYRLQAFKGKKDIGVELGRSKFVIRAQIPFNLYPEVLDHFSKISRGEVTVVLSGADEEDDSSFKYLRNIRPVDDATSTRLDAKLAEYLYEYFQGTCQSVCLSISHRHYRDYYRSSWFTLHYKGNKVCWSSPPSFEEIADCLCLFAGKQALRSPAYVLELLQQAHLKYSRAEKHNQNFPLIEFLNGEIRDAASHQVFFRNDGIWLKVTAEHLVTLQSTFYSLLNDRVLICRDKKTSGQLPIPWLAEERWSSFTPENVVQNGIDPREIDEVVGVLKGRTYAFVSRRGKVLVPYLTSCLLEGVTERSLSKLLDKRWDELSAFLQAHEGKIIHPADLEEVFPSSSSKKGGSSESLSSSVSTRSAGRRAHEVYGLLTEQRSICKELSVGRGARWPTVQLIDEEGKVLQADLTGVIFSSRIAIDHREWVEQYLSRCQASDTLFNDQEFVRCLSGMKYTSGRKISQKHAKGLVKTLKEPVQIECTFKGEMVVRFPPTKCGDILLSSGLTVSREVWTFLNERHEAYKRVCKEEGYSRQYLGKPGYIVCDQVYAGKKEKAELFDVLYHDTKTGKLYLYHIKGKFGQPTREACAQIRVAAQTLARDRAERYPHLKSLHTNAMASKGKSLFQQQVKEQFRALNPDKSDSSEGLIKLFNKDPENIIFVYAFIDTGSQERRLEEEQDPTHVFTPEEFSSEEVNVVEILQKAGHLNKEGRLKRKAIKATKERFKQDFQDVFHSCDLVFDQLNKYRSQFDSIGAKLELLHLRDHIRSQYSFGFQICQIDRSGFFPEANKQEGRLEMNADDFGGDLDEEFFHYGGEKYNVKVDTNYPPESVWHILGYPSTTPDYLKKFCYIHAWNQLPIAVIDPLLEARFPEVETPEGRRVAYTKLVWTHPLVEDDLAVAASVANKRCLVFPEVAGEAGEHVVSTENPVFDYNPEGAGVVCLVKRMEGDYSLCSQEGEIQPPFLLPNAEVPLMSHGIQNSGTDCFLNAVLQLVIHTSLINLFKDENLLLLDDESENYDYAVGVDRRDELIAEERTKREKVFSCLRNFLIEYALRHKEGKLSPPPKELRKAISELDMRSPNKLKQGQQDPSEVISLLRKCYDMSHYLWKVSKGMEVDRSAEIDITQTQGSISGLTMVDDRGRCSIGVDTPFILELPLPGPSGETPTLAGCLHSYCNETTTTGWKYSHGSQAFQSQASTRITDILGPQRGLLISYKRFNSRGEKIGLKVALDSLTVAVGSANYILKGFIVQIGATLSSGHYVAYCLSSSQWTQFNDDTLTHQTEDQVKVAVQDAYILFFEPEDSPSLTPATIHVGRELESQALDSESVSVDAWESEPDLMQEQEEKSYSDREDPKAVQSKKRNRSLSEEDQGLPSNKKTRQGESDDSKLKQLDSEEEASSGSQDSQDLRSKKRTHSLSEEDPALPSNKRARQHEKSPSDSIDS